jgi:hypothetical protein
MPINTRHLAVILAIALPASTLGGCGTINEKLADGMADYVPQWMGGLPADAPPRPGSAKYQAFMREQERKRLEGARATDGADQSSSRSGLNAVH